MAEMVAEALLSAIFQTLFNNFGSRLFADFFRGKKSMEDQLRALKRKLETVSLVVNDAEERQISEPFVRKWLDELKHTTLRTEDLVEEIKSEARTEQRSRNRQSRRSRAIVLLDMPISPDQYTEFDVSVQDEIVVILEDLDCLLDKMVVLGLRANSRNMMMTRSSVLGVLPPPLREASHVHGRDVERDEILKLLLSSDEQVWGSKIGVLPIVGMGGLGKTTLAQLVYDDERVREHKFELKAWVTVSTEFDVFKIIKALLQQIGGQSQSDELAILQREMKEGLRGKKFLFVLDDVWDEDYDNWDLLMSNFAPGDPRSKIVVTTRSGKVCSNVKTGPIHELNLVSDDDCWKIFVHHAFGGHSSVDRELQEIGKRIVDKCKGVPLAVKSVGGLLRSERNPKKWETILRSHVWEWSRSQGSGVLPSLWLSYRYLPSSAKQCFAYCAIFPQDYAFDKKDMVLLWMAEGFLQRGTEETSLEEVGDEYFEDLVSRSFFQRQSFYNSRYVMHDLVHDLATFVSGELCLSLSGNKKSGRTSSKTRYLLCDDKLESTSVKFLSQTTYLHTYIDGRYSRAISLVEEILEAGKFLRVLYMPSSFINELLSSPKNHLKHLRYLNLSNCGIEEVPDSVCTLYSLQTLVVSNCECLLKLPINMGNLIHLRHLDTSGSYLIKYMPPRMSNLKELRTLTYFSVGKVDDACSSIKELGELQHLSGEFSVCGLRNVETVDEAQRANFRDKVNLVKLSLEWKGEPADTRREREVLDALRPHTKLEELAVSGYAASSFPNWIGDSSFSKMVSVYLSGTSHDLCHSLPPLGQLPSLKKLQIESFNGVEKIGSEFYFQNNSSITTTPFPCLETLEFWGMKRLKEWSFLDRDGKEMINGCFPRLKHLSLLSCSLYALPPLGLLPSLKELEIMSFVDLEKIGSEFYGNDSSITPFPCLESLKFWNMKKWKEWSFVRSFPSLKWLFLLSCPNLVGDEGSVLDCETLETLEIQDSYNSVECFHLGNLPRLKSLTLSRCRNLKSLTSSTEDHSLLPSLTSLKIQNCPKMESFSVSGFPMKLTWIEISDSSKLVAQNSHWGLNKLTTLTSLSISTCDANLNSFPQGSLPSSLTSFELYGLPYLKSLNNAAFDELGSLERLNISCCHMLESLPDQVLSTSLCYLEIRNCPFLERRYRRDEGDQWHKISHIPYIRISGNTTNTPEIPYGAVGDTVEPVVKARAGKSLSASRSSLRLPTSLVLPLRRLEL